ncbi:MAG TPA: AAA family ATPase [Acidocella sp.]|nr:AAA family ATPase [Acidocella sp.]
MKLTALVRPSLTVVEQLGEDGGLRLARCWPERGSAPVLVVIPALEHPPASIIQRLKHEYALRTELAPAWAAHPVELRCEGERVLLVLADPGGRPLDRLLGASFQIGAFLHLAIPLTAAIGHAHACGLIHRDLKPANVLVETASSSVWLTGFGIASRLPREHQAPAPPAMIAGTLAYMAPEQTGRMNRSIDSRSDLYALGVIFYEMLTGTLPFTAADPMEWVHCHIARQPVPPGERVANIPEPLSAIVLKLLAKTADERYQTAAGLAVDLQLCLAEWQASGGIAPFPLGQRDVPDRLLIPEKLYGREHETETLLSAFDRMVASGAPELVLVSGYSGIGKSSVVNELHKALVPPRGLFASGKFDQYKRDIPYATLAQAFQSLVRPLLGQNEAELGRWRDALSEALGMNGQLIVNLVPELELVIGKQPPVQDLPPEDAQNRFQMVFRRFLGVFAKPEHPLALFLDDLQWLDMATLDLLEHLATHAEVRHLLLVGAYRDNEVGSAHPLMRTLEAIRKADALVEEIVLAPLGCDDVGRLIADALHCAPERARPLAQLVQEKTGGNPFFAIQFFSALAEEGLLAFDRATPAWQWDIDRIRAKSHTDNVVDLMAEKLKRLPTATQEALKQLACLGNVAETATLTLVHGETEAVMHAALCDAVRAGLVFREDTAYRFLHDRIQQAAYLLIPDEHRAALHLRIGRVLLAGMTPDQLAELLFEVANQFNHGAASLVDQDEKAQAATLNLRAGRKAKASAAYASASAYFSAGMALLDETDWDSQYELTFNLWLERAVCAFLTGEFKTAEKLIADLLQRGTSKVDLAAVYHLKIQFHVMTSENQQAVASAVTCLRLFGIDIPAHPTWEQVQAECEMVWQTLEGRLTESLIDLPLMTDSELQAAMRVLSVLTPPAYLTDFRLFCWLACRMVKLGMQHGISGPSTLGHALFGLFILGPVFHRYGEGYRFVKLACDLVEKHHFIAYQAKVYHAMGKVAFWTQPIGTAIDFMRATFRTAIETGDLTFACYATYQSVTGLLLRNDLLDSVWRESEMALDFTRKAKYGDIADIVLSQQRFIATMQGRTATFSTSNDAQFDEAAFETRLTRERTPLTTCIYWILKLKARFLSGDYAEAFAAAEKAKPLLSAAAANFQLLDYFYYAALTVAALHETASADEQTGWRDVLTAHQEQLREWADNYPPTFADKHALVAAEIARLEGRDADATRLYEQAIRSAREYGFMQNEGLALELAARFYAARGAETIAYLCLRNARYCYLRWGALGKVRQLEQIYPRILEDASPRASAATVGTSLEQLDIGTVVQAAQAVSGEILLDRLIETLMTLALEHAGAERGLLILLRGDVLQVAAKARTNHKTVEVMRRQETVSPGEMPETMLRTVLRTQQSVILDDAAAPNPFAADVYFQPKRIRSVLCLPLLKQTELIGLLYLENNLASHVFTPPRIAVLELLAAQAAISLENARLYTDLLQKNRERQTAEEGMQVSEARWRSLFERAPTGIVLVGPHGRYVEVNPAFCTMTGYSAAELRRLSPADITHEEDRAATEAILATRAAETISIPRIEKRYRRKDGGIIWVELSAFVAPIVGSAPLHAAVTVDITERKHAEAALRRSEAYLTEAQRLSRSGSFGWNVPRGDIFWSAESFNIFGYDKAPSANIEMVLQRVHPEDLALVQRVIGHASSTGTNFDFEHRLLMQDGTVRYVHVVGRAVRDQADELEFIGSVMDITAAKRAEESLQKAQADLAHAARVTTLGELAASIAHEINQPLAAVATSGNACLRWLGRDPPDLDAAQKTVARIVQDAHRAGDVIRSLRALAVKSGPQFTKLDLNGTIQEVLALTRSNLHRHGVALHMEPYAPLPQILGDKVQLQQVLLNLITNAVDAMSEITDRPKKLTITVHPAQPDGVLIGVEDTGTGFDPAAADQIFAPFYTTKSSGMGMGLSICKTIIEAHGGQLRAKPNLPQGAIFQFRLPADGRDVS